MFHRIFALLYNLTQIKIIFKINKFKILLFMNRLVICFEILPHSNDDYDIAIACYATIIFRVSHDKLVIKMTNMRLCKN